MGMKATHVLVKEYGPGLSHNRHRPRRRTIQYSAAPRSCFEQHGILDTPPSRGMTENGDESDSCSGERIRPRPEPQLSSSAKADDPVFRGASLLFRTARHTGYLASAGYDGEWG